MDSKSLGKDQLPPQASELICAFHNRIFTRVNFSGNFSAALCLKFGVKQGCVMVWTLFGIYISVLIHCCFPSAGGIALCTQRDGKLFNLAYLRAKTQTNTVFIHELMFADDAMFCAQTESKLQEVGDTFHASCNLFSLQISVQKTLHLQQMLHLPAS